MSKILNTGTVIIMLGLAAMVTAPAFARGGANFGRTTWPNPTVHVNYDPGYAGPLFHGHYPAHPAHDKRGH